MLLVRCFLACTVWMLAAFVWAQDAKELADLNVDNERRVQVIAAAKAELEKYNARLEKLEGDIAAAEQALQGAKDNLEVVSQAYKEVPTAANKRILDRASSGVVLAEHKLSSLQKRAKFAKTKKEVAEASISESLSRIAANKVRQDQLYEEIAIQEQAKKDAEQRAAELARKRAAEQQAALKRQAAELAAAEAAKAAEPKLSEADQALLKQARTTVKALEDYLAGDVKRSGELHKPSLVSDVDGEFDLEHLGGELYMVEVPLTGGEHRISIDTSKYRFIVSEVDAGEVFRIYFDNRDSSAKKLIAFKRSLL